MQKILAVAVASISIITHYNFCMTDIASLELRGPQERSKHALFDVTGKYAITSDCSNNIYIWDSKAGTLLQNLKNPCPIKHIGSSKNGQLIYTISEDNCVRLWHLLITTEPVIISHDGAIINNVSFSADSRYMLTASGDHTAKLWDLNDYSCKATLVGHNGGIYLTAFNNTGSQIATVSYDNTVRIWQIAGLKLLATLPLFHRACTLKFDKYEPILTVKTEFGFIKTWDLRPQKIDQPSEDYLIKSDSQFDKYLHEYLKDEGIIFIHPNNYFSRVCTICIEACRIWDPIKDSSIRIDGAGIFLDNPFNKHGNRIIVMEKTKAKILTDISHKKAISTLALALHPRLGTASPASLLPQVLFSKIHKKLLAYSFIKEPTPPQQEIKDSASENRQ